MEALTFGLKKQDEVCGVCGKTVPSVNSLSAFEAWNKEAPEDGASEIPWPEDWCLCSDDGIL